ncbi:MAG: dihydrodipicolinate synthase family protein [Fimbriimonadaceae bacterium]|nr:dihydrodipicolinate synthase family protein [Fimbriimonadaceae bacterium]QYK56606.1 MAG: dihydrodipicolinate synthase family protein [Fimbriimonadaceae bacterium]
MLSPGVYPAAITPFGVDGRVDEASLARLLAWFEAAGCQGVVVAGTNGEGPSLSAVEKRDLARVACRLRGSLRIVTGVATPSLDEAKWLLSQAGKAGVDAGLVMPPSYFRRATEAGLLQWFREVLEDSPVPILVYNYPKMTGIELSPEFVTQLAGHSQFLGLKDSSGVAQNLPAFREALPDKLLFVGDETLLGEALREGWTGTISGVGNVAPAFLVQAVRERSEPKLRIVQELAARLRALPQPETHKAVLHALGVIERPTPRLPLVTGSPDEALQALEAQIGLPRASSS